MKTIEKFWKPVILSWSIFIPLTALLHINREWSWYANITICILFYFLMTIIFNRKDLPKIQRLINILLIISPLLPLIAFYAWRGQGSFLTVPLYIFNPIIGISFGLVYLTLKKLYLKISIVIILIAFCGWSTIKAIHIWKDFFTYDTWSGITDETINDFCLNSKDGKVCKADFKNKIIVLDFWNTSCGRCYAAFPKYAEQITKWSKDNDIEFYTVNVPLETDSIGQAGRVLESLGYNFNNLLAYSLDSTLQIFKVVAFPTSIVFDKNGKIVYRGNPDKLGKVLRKMKKLNDI